RSDLWEIKKEINAEISQLWDDYRENKQSYERLGFLFSLFTRRKGRYWRYHSNNRGRLHDSRREQLQPYERLREEVDGYINQIERTRQTISRAIDRHKRQQKATRNHKCESC